MQLVPFKEASEAFLSDSWMVEDVLPKQGLAVMFGAPGSGKTYTAIDLACHVASGQPEWRGKYVEHKAVLYLSLEGGKPFRNRLHAWRMHYGVEDAVFHRCSEKLDLRSTETDCNRVIAAGRDVSETTRHKIGLVVVDTLNRAMPGGNENGVEDMGAFITHCDAIARALDCLVLIVHHSGKDVAKGSRGHSSLLGAIDTELSVSNGAITITKQRDGEGGQKFGFTLTPIEIGETEERGKQVFACVVEAAEVPEKSVTLSKPQQAVMEALYEFTIDHGEPNPGGTGWPERGKVRVVDADAFRKFAAGRMHQSEPKRRSEAVKRACETLVTKGLIGANQNKIWATKLNGRGVAKGRNSANATSGQLGSGEVARSQQPYRAATCATDPETQDPEMWQ